MRARIRDHLLQGRQFVVEISALLIHEREPAPDIEVVRKFRGRFRKKIGSALRVLVALLERNTARQLSLLIAQAKVAWAGFLGRNVRLALIKIVIRARDPSVVIVSRLLSPLGE